jgi:hypothetical protein
MIADEHDEITYAKILAAAEEIRAMAGRQPAHAAAMFEQARHLFELAQQIRNDWLRRRHTEPNSGAFNTRSLDPGSGRQVEPESGSPGTTRSPG